MALRQYFCFCPPHLVLDINACVTVTHTEKERKQKVVKYWRRWQCCSLIYTHIHHKTSKAQNRYKTSGGTSFQKSAENPKPCVVGQGSLYIGSLTCVMNWMISIYLSMIFCWRIFKSKQAKRNPAYHWICFVRCEVFFGVEERKKEDAWFGCFFLVNYDDFRLVSLCHFNLSTLTVFTFPCISGIHSTRNSFLGAKERFMEVERRCFYPFA